MAYTLRFRGGSVTGILEPESRSDAKAVGNIRATVDEDNVGVHSSRSECSIVGAPEHFKPTASLSGVSIEALQTNGRVVNIRKPCAIVKPSRTQEERLLHQRRQPHLPGPRSASLEAATTTRGPRQGTNSLRRGRGRGRCSEGDAECAHRSAVYRGLTELVINH